MLVRPNHDIEAVFAGPRLQSANSPAVWRFVGGLCAVAVGVHGRAP